LLEIFIDGASRGNPGLSAVGIVVYNENNRILTYREFIGSRTNNQAEYHALKRALQITNLIGDRIIIFSDSNLLVNQRLKKYRIRNNELKEISREISNLEDLFVDVQYRYVSRRINTQADAEANRAIDDYIKYEGTHNLTGSSDDSELNQYKLY
jgi:ribonuclease HI